MQRAAIIALLALVACANAQLFQQNYDYRSNLIYRPVAGNIDGSIAFAGALAYLPPAEFVDALRFSSVYTQIVRPAVNWTVAIDARTGIFSESQLSISATNAYLIISAVSEESQYRESDVVIVKSANPDAVCFGLGVSLALNSPLPHSFNAGTGLDASALRGATSCLIKESDIVAKLSFDANREEAAALSLENFRFVRRDLTIFGPTVF